MPQNQMPIKEIRKYFCYSKENPSWVALFIDYSANMFYGPGQRVNGPAKLFLLHLSMSIHIFFPVCCLLSFIVNALAYI